MTQYLLSAITCILCLHHFSLSSVTPIFDNTLTLSQFGSITNTIATMQSSANFVDDQSTLRTNDFQNLQLNYMNYGTARPITRFGAFLISQSAANSSQWPGGPGVTFPALKYSNDPTQSPANPALNLTTNNTTSLLVFTSSETTSFDLSADLGVSSTRQALELLYANPSNSGQYIKDFCVSGSAFHDILYQDLTPVIWADGYTHLTGITVYSAAHPEGQAFTNPVPPNGFTLPAGHKFKLSMLDVPTNQTQTWILYLQPPDNTTPSLPELVFKANFNGSATTLLDAQSTFDGFIRNAIVQTTAVPYSPQPSTTATEVPQWSTSLGIQVIAPSPAGMFMLWPESFTPTAKTKIEYNFTNQINLPYCPWLSVYLPVVACNDFATASNYFYKLMADIPPPANNPYPFDNSTNPFLTYLYMLIGNLYEPDIATYQKNIRPFPNYLITATSSTVESVYDTYRDAIPTSAEIAFGSNTYNWTYTTIVRQGAANSEPLIIFPGYKTLDAPSSAVAGFMVLDPIKGPLYASATSSNQVFFKEGAFPSFLTSQFYPSDLWTRISAADQTVLMKYLNQALTNQLLPVYITPLSSQPDAYANGKILHQAAQTVLYGSSLMAQQGMSQAAIKTATQPLIDAIKSVMQDWLFNIQAKLRQQQGANYPTPFAQNYFIGDSTVGGGGVCYSVQGMLGSSALDFGNAFYNDHHFAYGYWLGAAAAVIEWDNIYGPISPNPVTTPWIATTFPSGSGTGSYKMKAFLDMLWRDTRNPDPNDPDLPFSRHSNFWEGHSTANGLALGPYSAGRNQESLAEDFNCWLGTLFYAQAILNTSTNPDFVGALTASDIQGFSTLVDFCTTNLSMTATAGNLYYNTPNWPYAALGFNFNANAAQQYDNLVDSATFFNPGSPPCTCVSETIINSTDRFEDFYEYFFSL